MSRQRLTVVLSQAQGKHPGKRALEEAVVAALIMEPGLDVSVIPYLYDLGPDHTGRLFLESVQGDMVVLAWMFPRAAFWVLDRDGIKGHFGETRLKPPDADEDDEAGEPEPPKGIGTLDAPDRHIYCLDLRDFNNHQPYVDEVRRIVAECKEWHEAKLKQWVNGNPSMVQLGRYLRADEPAPVPEPKRFAVEQLAKEPGRRWYPVIDYSRCTNCMECIDFCLFGVYGVDNLDRILVENQDNCKRGCPACSNTGYRERQALFEFMVNDAAVCGLIHEKGRAGRIRQSARHSGLRTLREEGIRLIFSGQTTPEEVLRVTQGALELE